MAVFIIEFLLLHKNIICSNEINVKNLRENDTLLSWCFHQQLLISSMVTLDEWIFLHIRQNQLRIIERSQGD